MDSIAARIVPTYWGGGTKDLPGRVDAECGQSRRHIQARLIMYCSHPHGARASYIVREIIDKDRFRGRPSQAVQRPLIDGRIWLCDSLIGGTNNEFKRISARVDVFEIVI